MAGTPQEALAIPAALQSLLNRSITALSSLGYVRDSRDEVFEKHTNELRKISSLDSHLKYPAYWFFQLRDSPLSQDGLEEWDPNRWDGYLRTKAASPYNAMS